jgi:hypothetical protein
MAMTAMIVAGTAAAAGAASAAGGAMAAKEQAKGLKRAQRREEQVRNEVVGLGETEREFAEFYTEGGMDMAQRVMDSVNMPLAQDPGFLEAMRLAQASQSRTGNVRSGMAQEVSSMAALNALARRNAVAYNAMNSLTPYGIQQRQFGAGLMAEGYKVGMDVAQSMANRGAVKGAGWQAIGQGAAQSLQGIGNAASMYMMPMGGAPTGGGGAGGGGFNFAPGSLGSTTLSLPRY